MGMVMGVTAVIVGFAAALAGLIVWTALIFPNPAAWARTALETRPGRCLLMGVLVAALLGIPVLALLHSPHGYGKIAGWMLAFPLLSTLVVGLTGMAQLLGARLRPLSPAMTPLGALVRGAITLELAALMPFFGWFLFTPLVALTVAGAGALGVLAGRGTAAKDGDFATETRRQGEREEEEMAMLTAPDFQASTMEGRVGEPAGAV